MMSPRTELARLCASGYVILKAFGDHHFQAFREVLGSPEWCAGDQWKSMKYRANHLMDIASHLDAWMLKQKKAGSYT